MILIITAVSGVKGNEGIAIIRESGDVGISTVTGDEVEATKGLSKRKGFVEFIQKILESLRFQLAAGLNKG